MSPENTAAAVEAPVEAPPEVETVEVDGKKLPVEVVDGRRQAKDENGNVYILADANKKLTALERKRLKIYNERRQRAINKGVDPKKVDAVLAEEDYRNMPLDEKFEQHTKVMTGTLRRLAQDINGLQHNDNVLADSMDINFRAFAKMLVKAGITLEDQGVILREVEAEVMEDRKKQAEMRQVARQQAAQDLAAKEQATKEKASAEALAAAEGKPSLTPDQPPPTEAPVPEGATTFGGVR